MCYFFSRCLTRWIGLLVNVFLCKLTISLCKKIRTFRSLLYYLVTWTSYFTQPYPYSHLTVNEFTLNETKTPQTVDQQAIWAAYFHFMDTMWSRSYGKNFDVNLRQQHTESETRTLSTTNVFHPQELNTFWIASGEFSGLNYLLCSSYVELLEAFLRYTSADHVDRKKLTQAIGKFKDLDTLFRQVTKKLLSLIHTI